MSKILIFALHVKTDRKLTVVNKITRNLFLQQPKGIDKSTLISCQPNRTSLPFIIFCPKLDRHTFLGESFFEKTYTSSFTVQRSSDLVKLKIGFCETYLWHTSGVQV